MFRPDWENVIGPVVDYLFTRPEVDRTRVALIGNQLWWLSCAPRGEL